MPHPRPLADDFVRTIVSSMSPAFYDLCRLAGRFVKVQCIREVVLDAHRADRPGGLLVACTHIGHLEPFVVSSIVKRRVRWMSRMEFYQSRWKAAALNLGGAFPVDRFGNSIPAVRKAIALASQGEMVGIFPEGGVVKGQHAMMRGAAFKHGVCTVSVATRLPILPVVVLGAHELSRVAPWLPFKRGRLYVAFGHDVLPPPRSGSRRADRLEMAGLLQAEFVRTYNDLLNRTGLQDTDIP